MTIPALLLTITNHVGIQYHGGLIGDESPPELMAEYIKDFDAHYAPDEKDEYCGGNRSLASVPGIIRDMGFRADIDGDDGRIFDDVVMDYWESRDDDRYWTPLCVARYGLFSTGPWYTRPYTKAAKVGQ